jgi:hypothetical protein
MKWVYKTKTKIDANMEKLKLCLVVWGFEHEKGID